MNFAAPVEGARNRGFKGCRSTRRGSKHPGLFCQRECFPSPGLGKSWERANGCHVHLEQWSVQRVENVFYIHITCGQRLPRAQPSQS